MIDQQYVVDTLEALPEPPGITLSGVRGVGHVKAEQEARPTKRIKLHDGLASSYDLSLFLFKIAGFRVDTYRKKPFNIYILTQVIQW